MGLLSKLFGAPSVPPTQWHSLAGADGVFVTLSSDGLRAFGQREVVFTLRAQTRAALEPALVEIPRFLTALRQLAEAGRTVTAGEFTQFGDRGMLGQRGNGILYVEPEPMPGVTLPTDALAAVVLDPGEMALVAEGLTQRVLTRRGARHTRYPHPCWTDVPLVSGAMEPEPSLLNRVNRARMPGVTATLEGGRLRVTMGPMARARLTLEFAKQGREAPMAFLTDWSPSANARLVWNAGQTGPAAITPPGSDGSRVGGAFLVVTGGSETDEAKLIEDGFALIFSEPTLARFWNAIANREVLRLECGEKSLQLEW